MDERPLQPRLCDVSLRDGEQAIDAAFTSEEKTDLATSLDAIGVHQIQVGFAHGDGPTAARSIKEAGVSVPVELLCITFRDDWRRDVDVSAESGVEVLQLLMRTTDPLLNLARLSRLEAIRRIREAVLYAVDAEIQTVVLGASFATQADPDFVVQLSLAAVDAGAARVILADTIGAARPSEMSSLVARVREAVDVPVGVHCHNDFGLAVAGTLAALEAGADWADVSICGIGERAGNASLEAVVMALKVLYGIDVGINSTALRHLAERLASILRRSLSPSQPIVGDHVFAQKLDLHVEVAARFPELLEPFDPALVGGQRTIHLGKGSGPHAVQSCLARLGHQASDDETLRLAAWVNNFAEITKRCVTDAELLHELKD